MSKPLLSRGLPGFALSSYSTSVDPASAQMLADNAAIYQNINDGWNAVKLVGLTIIPYCWVILPRSFLWDTLMWGFAFDLLHCIMVFCAFAVPVYTPTSSSQPFWIVQCLVAAFVRIVEIVYNGKLLSAIQKNKIPIWQWIWFTIASVGVIFGRLFDTLWAPTGALGAFQVRLGMCIVSASGIFASLPVIWIMFLELRDTIKSSPTQGMGSSIVLAISQAATRLIFLNFIDAGLFCVMIVPGTSANPFIRWFFDNWDNSRLAYYAVDALLSKLLTKERRKSNISRPGDSNILNVSSPKI
ncbi:hypothetical protein BC830DRAFT_1132597, partial [Chytriomyces sp. MP71]